MKHLRPLLMVNIIEIDLAALEKDGSTDLHNPKVLPLLVNVVGSRGSRVKTNLFSADPLQRSRMILAWALKTR